MLAGHSMGGMISTIVGARDAKLLGVGLISAADMAGRTLPAVQAGHGDAAIAPTATSLERNGLYPLAGCTAESLARDLVTNAVAWSIPAQATGLSAHPLLVISSDDGLAPATDKLMQNIRAISTAKPVTATHLATDHSYSDKRIALEEAFLKWLERLHPVNPTN